MDDKEKIILDKMTKTCTCKSISRYKIKRLIEEGYDDLESIQKKTGAGSGACKGRYCTEKILDLINEYWQI